LLEENHMQLYVMQ